MPDPTPVQPGAATPDDVYLTAAKALGGNSSIRTASGLAQFDRFRAAVDAARASLVAEVSRLREHILDICAHATPYGDLPADPGYVGTYLLTAGALHRALGTIGHTAPSCTAEAERDQALKLAHLTTIDQNAGARMLGEARDERDEARAEVERLTAHFATAERALAVRQEEIATLLAALGRLVDNEDDPCQPNHHGDCETHLSSTPCATAEARRLLGLDGGSRG